MTDRAYMLHAISLAQKGEGWCHPNPMVGAVVVKEGRIIGEGYHARRGEAHAERNALASLTESAEGATMYVTLEPCCHYGKTPPCTEAIIAHGLARVVIGSRDPNPRVAGGGVRALREAGIEVVEDFLREECDALNPVFFHYITERTPYVVMKYAMTADGKIATRTGASRWITGEAARQRVQELRHACMGIMVGIGTVLKDDPLLTCRLEGGRNPVRIVCDSGLRIPVDSQLCRTAREVPLILACARPDLEPGWLKEAKGPGEERVQELLDCGAEILNVPGEGQVDLPALMRRLGEREIDSVLLEGGARLNESALRAGIVKEIRCFIAPKIFGGVARTPVEGLGVERPDEALPLSMERAEMIGEDLMVTCRILKKRMAGRED